jgi:hypothetical protein
MRIYGAERFCLSFFEDMLYIEPPFYGSCPSRGDSPLYMLMLEGTKWFCNFWLHGPAALCLSPEWPMQLLLLHSSLSPHPITLIFYRPQSNQWPDMLGCVEGREDGGDGVLCCAICAFITPAGLLYMAHMQQSVSPTCVGAVL